MRYKTGEKYDAEYPIHDEEGNEMDRFFLHGIIVYSDHDSFIVCDYDNGSNIEVISSEYSGLTFEQCKEFFPKLDHQPREKKIDSHGFLLRELFVPLSQETEDFLFWNGMLLINY